MKTKHCLQKTKVLIVTYFIQYQMPHLLLFSVFRNKTLCDVNLIELCTLFYNDSNRLRVALNVLLCHFGINQDEEYRNTNIQSFPSNNI